jgi:hypothetical protein
MKAAEGSVHKEGGLIMDAQKMSFLLDLVKEANTQNSNSMIPFLLSVTSRANQKGITFSDDETELIVNQLKKNMKPEDQAKIEMIRKMSSMLAKKQQ